MKRPVQYVFATVLFCDAVAIFSALNGWWQVFAASAYAGISLLIHIIALAKDRDGRK